MSDCFCDYEPASVYTKTTPTARSEHRCEECGAPILPGEKYERVFAVWDGYPTICKTCERCVEVRRFVKESVPCFCWAHGSLHDDAQETARRYAHEADGLLFGTLRRIVIARKRRRPLAPHRKAGAQ